MHMGPEFQKGWAMNKEILQDRQGLEKDNNRHLYFKWDPTWNDKQKSYVSGVILQQ